MMIKKKFFKAQVFILSNYFIRKKKSLRHFCQKKKKMQPTRSVILKLLA